MKITYPRYRDARKSTRFLTKQERKLKAVHTQTLLSVRGSKLKDTNGKSSLFGHFRSNNLNIPLGRLAAITVREPRRTKCFHSDGALPQIEKVVK